MPTPLEPDAGLFALGGKTVGLAIFDHPSNPRHPTTWHVRDYGLFAANPFALHDMERKPAHAGDMKVEPGQSVIAMLVAEDETQSVLTATERGYGKRTSIVEYTRHGRGTKGMIAIQQSERNGKVVAATLVRADDEIMLITDKGVLVRTRVAEIRELGRATQGVTLIALDGGDKLSGVQRLVENDANGDASADTNSDTGGDPRGEGSDGADAEDGT